MDLGENPVKQEVPPLPCVRLGEAGIAFQSNSKPITAQISREVFGLIQQLRGAEILLEGEGEELLTWSEAYRLMESGDEAQLADILQLPPIWPVAPSLRSHGSLTSKDFSISIDGWYRTDQHREVRSVTPVGALIYVGEEKHLLPKESYELLVGLRKFSLCTDHDTASNRRNWGYLRKLAINARANLDAFLYDTIVVTPDKLQIRLRPHRIGDDNVITVEPWFEGAPVEWLTTFDRFSEARPLYSIPTDRGIVHVEVRPDVQSALKEIKQMPGRRVAGKHAESFLANPFAMLGPGASSVIDEQEFIDERASVGLAPCEFRADVRMDDSGAVLDVALIVFRGDGNEFSECREVFKGSVDLGNAINIFDSHLAAGVEVAAWRRYLLSLSSSSEAEIAQLRAAFDSGICQAI